MSDINETLESAQEGDVSGKSRPSGRERRWVDDQDHRDAIRRAWEHGMHEDNNLVQRGNLYLVAESMILVAFSFFFSNQASSSDPKFEFASRVIAGFGLLISLAWIYAGHRHWQYFRTVRARAVDLLPDFREIRERASRGPSSTTVIVYVIPAIAATMWLILIFVV